MAGWALATLCHHLRIHHIIAVSFRSLLLSLSLPLQDGIAQLIARLDTRFDVVGEFLMLLLELHNHRIASFYKLLPRLRWQLAHNLVVVRDFGLVLAELGNDGLSKGFEHCGAVALEDL
eukprot:GEZU01043492.1.p1 GENE.GEZU01043492.1~~GEZU01043492.1.p1  ORF type:complete len:119 (-),score=20.00 GEZU01043492.1:4-360(-)